MQNFRGGVVVLNNCNRCVYREFRGSARAPQSLPESSLRLGQSAPRGRLSALAESAPTSDRTSKCTRAAPLGRLCARGPDVAASRRITRPRGAPRAHSAAHCPTQCAAQRRRPRVCPAAAGNTCAEVERKVVTVEEYPRDPPAQQPHAPRPLHGRGAPQHDGGGAAPVPPHTRRQVCRGPRRQSTHACSFCSTVPRPVRQRNSCSRPAGACTQRPASGLAAPFIPGRVRRPVPGRVRLHSGRRRRRRRPPPCAPQVA